MGYNDQIQQAITEVSEQELAPCVTLSTGVILRFKKVNILRIMELVNRFKYPPVPKIQDEKRGREIDNPHDPVYVRTVNEIDNQRGLAMIDAILAFGTQVEHIPEDVIPVESDVWINDLELVGIEINQNHKTARYLAWTKYVAILDSADVEKITAQFNVSVGTSEGAIAKSLANNFPD